MSDRPSDADHRRILIVGSCVFRKGVASIACGLVPSTAIVESWCFHDARARLMREEFSIAIFDVDTDDFNGPGDLRMLHASYPRLVLAVFSRADRADEILDYLAAGVTGYVRAYSSQSEIEWAIRSILDGEIHVPSSLTTPMAHQPIRNPQLPFVYRDRRQLTARQSAVLRLLREGRSNKEIAKELNVSPHTTKIHVAALLRHFSVQSRSALAIVALQNGHASADCHIQPSRMPDIHP